MASINDPAPGLLFGLLALQNGLIDSAALVAAFDAWTRDKGRPLVDHLVASGHLDPAHRPMLEDLATAHLSGRGGDPEESPAAPRVGRSTHETTGAADPGVETTVDADHTASDAVGAPTTDGRRFHILRPHARGGLGAVFVALDLELHREVALKQILDQHADDPSSRRRFLLEAEITGGLEHPGIVPVYGLGAHEDGRPYYAMRFIRGESLKEAIERFHTGAAARSAPGRRSLELRKLLRRFIDVCNAIEYAHSREVIHRDLKPANIVVGQHGETLVVDWGLAKARGRSAAEESSDERPLVPRSASESAETLAGSALGTPAYMSPEQAYGDLDHLGPRSDVYSLGATLHCLLTGQPPFTGDDVGAVLRAAQAGRFTPPRQIDPTIDRALEAVCLMAMARQPEDRYDSPRALAEDVERWMADEPVSAWREPVSRRARRWARRNRSLVTSASAAGLVAMAGLAVVLAVQARANTRLQVKNQALAAAQQETATERDTARAINAFLVDDLLAQANPDNNPVEDKVTVLEILDRAAERVPGQFDRQPQVEATVRLTIGTTYHGLGQYPRAESHIRAALDTRRRVLGPEHADTLTALDTFATVIQDQSRLDEAEPLFRRCLEARRRVLGPEHPDTLSSASNLGVLVQLRGRLDEAESLLRSCLEVERRVNGSEHIRTLGAMQNLGSVYIEMGRNGEAQPLLAEAYAVACRLLGPENPTTLTVLNNLATSNQNLGRLDEAESLFRRLLASRRRVLGARHHHTLLTVNNLALLLHRRGKLEEAEPLFQQALAIDREILGEDHLATLTALLNLAALRLDRGQLDRAKEACVRGRDMSARINGPDHFMTLSAMNNLAIVEQERGSLAEAEALLRRTLDARRRVVGREHPVTLLTATNLGNVLLDRHQVGDAERLLSETLTAQSKILPRGHSNLASTLGGLGLSLTRSGRPREAEPLLVEALEIRRRTLPAGDRRISLAESALGECLAAQRRFVEAEPLLTRSAERLLATPEAAPIRRRQAIERTIALYGAWLRPDEAAAWRARLPDADFPADPLTP